jgi:hypothetical protein
MECAVCYERLSAPLKLSCKHSYCRKCIEEWFISSPAEVPGCPTCRRPIRGKVAQGLEEARCDKMEGSIFAQVLEEYLEDWREFLGDFEADDEDHRLFRCDLSNVQQTVKSLWNYGLPEDEILEFVDYHEWQPWKPFAPKGWIAWDPPSQKFYDTSRRIFRGSSI